MYDGCPRNVWWVLQECMMGVPGMYDGCPTECIMGASGMYDGCHRECIMGAPGMYDGCQRECTMGASGMYDGCPRECIMGAPGMYDVCSRNVWCVPQGMYNGCLRNVWWYPSIVTQSHHNKYYMRPAPFPKAVGFLKSVRLLNQAGWAKNGLVEQQPIGTAKSQLTLLMDPACSVP